MSTERDGQTYNLPTVWDGQELDPQAAKPLISALGSQGWNRFPAYPDKNTAEARYQQMHRYMDQDVANTYGRK
jgi:hypothetical protein